MDGLHQLATGMLPPPPFCIIWHQWCCQLAIGDFTAGHQLLRELEGTVRERHMRKLTSDLISAALLGLRTRGPAPIVPAASQQQPQQQKQAPGTVSPSEQQQQQPSGANPRSEPPQQQRHESGMIAPSVLLQQQQQHPQPEVSAKAALMSTAAVEDPLDHTVSAPVAATTPIALPKGLPAKGLADELPVESPKTLHAAGAVESLSLDEAAGMADAASPGMVAGSTPVVQPSITQAQSLTVADSLTGGTATGNADTADVNPPALSRKQQQQQQQAGENSAVIQRATAPADAGAPTPTDVSSKVVDVPSGSTSSVAAFQRNGESTDTHAGPALLSAHHVSSSVAKMPSTSATITSTHDAPTATVSPSTSAALTTAAAALSHSAPTIMSSVPVAASPFAPTAASEVIHAAAAAATNANATINPPAAGTQAIAESTEQFHDISAPGVCAASAATNDASAALAAAVAEPSSSGDAPVPAEDALTVFPTPPAVEDTPAPAVDTHAAGTPGSFESLGKGRGRGRVQGRPRGRPPGSKNKPLKGPTSTGPPAETRPSSTATMPDAAAELPSSQQQPHSQQQQQQKRPRGRPPGQKKALPVPPGVAGATEHATAGVVSGMLGPHRQLHPQGVTQDPSNTVSSSLKRAQVSRLRSVIISMLLQVLSMGLTLHVWSSPYQH